MTHSHFGSQSTGPVGAPPMVDPDELRRHRRALRILVVVLIPLAIWTVVGLIPWRRASALTLSSLDFGHLLKFQRSFNALAVRQTIC